MVEDVLEIAHWHYLPSSGELQNGDLKVRLEPQSQSLFNYFLQKPNKIIPIAELAESVWQGRFASDDTVRRAISRLRSILGDTASSPVFIETIPKRGFRLLITPVLKDQNQNQKKKYLLQFLSVFAILLLLGVLFLNKEEPISLEIQRAKHLMLNFHPKDLKLAYQYYDAIPASSLTPEQRAEMVLLLSSEYGFSLGFARNKREQLANYQLQLAKESAPSARLTLLAEAKYQLNIQNDQKTALKSIKFSVNRYPNDGQLIHLYAQILRANGFHQQSLEQLIKAEPFLATSVKFLKDKAWQYYLVSDFENARLSYLQITQFIGKDSGWLSALIDQATQREKQAAEFWLERNKRTGYSSESILLAEQALKEQKLTEFYKIFLSATNKADYEDPGVLAIWLVNSDQHSLAKKYISKIRASSDQYWRHFVNQMPIFSNISAPMVKGETIE